MLIIATILVVGPSIFLAFFQLLFQPHAALFPYFKPKSYWIENVNL